MKRGYYKHTNTERETWENKNPLVNEAEQLVTNDMEKVEILSASFALDFTSKTNHQEYQAPETRGKVWNEEDTFGEGGSSKGVLKHVEHP